MTGPGVRLLMRDPSYYRDQAERALRLAWAVADPEAARALYEAARDYDDVAEDLEGKMHAQVAGPLHDDRIRAFDYARRRSCRHPNPK